jgi:hypothetical protein
MMLNDRRFTSIYSIKFKEEQIVGCDEVCGDGKNMGFVECDDGNKLNGGKSFLFYM